ncbi:hypothetical protein LTR29_012943 [Friedmanniomyces endolithicus]|nr:hypothetical protein LTR29_012943 [Friedmanniomyces endolithicus]
MSAQWPARLQPAQLAFLAIYNPALGPTDETFADQCVYWYSRKAAEARVAAKQSARKTPAGDDAAREDENEKLRQIGLAQGMVGFAKSFSKGEPVDSIETERSRVVLHDLEQGWWILASVDLTRLPSIQAATSELPKKGTEKAGSKASFEYSSREVSPPALLIRQLAQAHQIFLLHHGFSLDELFVRLRHDKFCSVLDRFWSRFTKHWDVLLHGNPAADVFGGLKLASGGELGFGVGEEAWGSGEREVLEDLAHRTEGLIDVIVSRFGEPAQAVASDDTSLPDSETLPWMGSGSQPAASDGVVFSGVGAIARPSLRTVSLWMRQIYTYGEYAYGVRDNPVRERRKRRPRKSPVEDSEPPVGDAPAPKAPLRLDPRKLRQRARKITASGQATEGAMSDGASGSDNATVLPEAPATTVQAKIESQDHAASSPAHKPLVPGVEKLDKQSASPPGSAAAPARAPRKADQDSNHTNPADADDTGTTWGVPDTFMKYLTFGISELAKPSKPQRPPVTKRTTTSKSTTATLTKNATEQFKAKTTAVRARAEDAPMMTHLDPMPDSEPLQARIAAQRRRENSGHFVIGLKGDLDEIPDDIEADMTDGSIHDDTGGPRTILRTLQIELVSPPERAVDDEETLNEALRRTASSAGSSSSPALKSLQRLRVLVYVHRPFMYCFLFEDRTSSLAYPGFYKELHRNLLPVHKPLLSSTNVAKVAQRIEASHSETVEDTASVRSVGSTNTLPSKGGSGVSGMRPIFDLIYDPRLLTVHTSIPNIPEPGTPAAEGLGLGASREQAALPAGWTRLDALNVHSQVLSTLHDVKGNKSEMERTSKTSRGWWVVWMRVPPSAGPAGIDALSNAERPVTAAAASSTTVMDSDHRDERENAEETLTGPSTWNRPSTYIPSVVEPREPADMHRMAFLVRKSSDAVTGPTVPKASTSSRVASGMWSTLTLRPAWDPTMAEDEKPVASASGSGWGPAALTGGMGVDARKYVEGLLSLNR